MILQSFDSQSRSQQCFLDGGAHDRITRSQSVWDSGPLGPLQLGQRLRRNVHGDAARLAGNASNEAAAFQREDHLMHARGCDLKERCMSASDGAQPFTMR